MSRRNVVIAIIAGLALVLVAAVLVIVLVVKPDIPLLGGRNRSPEALLAELDPLAPVVADRLPQRGVELQLNGTMDIFFDQPMNQTATVNAFNINPPVGGGFAWLDDNTLRFTPAETLQRATTYTVTLDTGTTSANGLTLQEPVALDFKTVGYLEVGQVVPASETNAVEPQSVITVMFNRPVVPLVIAEEQAGLPQPLELQPPAAGHGEWLNTSIYQFTPDTALAGGQTYTARIAAGLMDTTGGLMVEDYVWSFTTLPPSVVDVFPESDSSDVTLDEEIRVNFNQPMDTASVESAFSLQADGASVGGQFAWEDDNQTLVFKPSGLMALGGRYRVAVSENALAASRETNLVQSYEWFFNTVHSPAIINIEPGDGTAGADPTQAFTLTFASPMDEDTLDERVIFNPPLPDTAEAYYDEYNRSLSFYGGLQPSTTYTVEILSGMADPYGNAIGGRTVGFTTRQAEPEIWLNVPDRIGFYDSAVDTQLFAVFRNTSTLNFRLSRVSTTDFARLTGPDSYQIWEGFRPSEELRSWSIEVEPELNEYTFIKVPVVSDNGGALAAGFYMLEMSSPDVAPHFNTRHLMIVASANLTFKSASHEGLVWLTDLRSGQPLPNRTVTFYDDTFAQIGQGTTGDNGLVHAALPSLDEGLYNMRYALVEGGDTFAVAISEWDRGLQGYEFGLPTTFFPVTTSIYLYTDRPLYRPGQEVSFKGIIRNVDDATYTLPDIADVPVQIYNNQGDLIYDQRVALTQFGTFSGQFTLSEEGEVGYYRIEVNLNQRTGAGLGFQVAEYRKPEFQVALTPTEPEVSAGETIRVEGEATFFFGGAVSNAEVTWTALLVPYNFSYDGPGYWNFTDLYEDDTAGGEFIPGYGRVVTEGTTTTDANGRFVVELPADLGEQSVSGTFTIEATVSDIDERTVSNRTDVIVHKGDFYVGLSPEEYVGQAGQPMGVNVLTLTPQGEPVERQDLNVTVVERRWSSVREEDEYGRKVWVYNVEEIPVESLTVRTDNQGEARFEFTPPSGGVFRVRAAGLDAGGREISSSAYTWVAGSGYVPWRQQNNNRFDLVADRQSYAPGDTAEILIASPFQGSVQALITIERGGILSSEVLTLNSNSHVYNLPITGDLAPNVYVSVVLVKGVDDTNPVPAFKMGMVELEVEPSQQTINVEVTPDRDKVGPGEEVTYTLRTTDYTGQPVSAEVSLALADVAALSLAGPNSGTILDHFYGNMPLAVRTSLGLTLSVDQLNQELFDRGKGGGGGGEEGFFEVRGDFRDTAYWQADVVTNAQGEASVTLSLPDNLTTWRMDARAVTQNTLVGDATVDILATKDLLVRPGTPRFFVVGDQAQLGAIVHNNTDKNINNVRVELESTGADFAEGTDAVQRIDIPAGGRVEVFWNVSVQDVNFVDLTFSAQGGGLSDASKPTSGLPPDQLIPVYRFDAPETIGTAGTLDTGSTRVEAIVLPQTFEVTQGQLDVTLSPSLAASMTGSLRYLEDYPYQCTEQTISRFLPNVLTARALRDLGLQDPELQVNLDQNVNTELQRLYSQQHVDGGWGWWVRDDSSPLVSAWVVLGLVEARASGYAVSPDAVDRGVGYLQNSLQGVDALDSNHELNRQAFILYVLAKAGQPDVSRTVQLYDVRQGMDHYARAYLAQTLWMIDPADTRINNILSDLNNAAITSATGVHWEETVPDTYNWNSNTRSTAIILDTLVKLNPTNALNPGVVRWLMVARQGDHWENTQETAWALIALTDWMAVTGELNANYDFDVALNGQELASGQANPSTLRTPTTLQVEVERLARQQANQLAITRGNGPGNLYYTAHLSVGLPVEEVQPLSRGMILSRQYFLASDPDRPTTSAHVGDEILVKLTIIVPENRNYVVIEDPFPAGTEAVDTNLLTTSILGQRPELESDDPLKQGWGWWYFSMTQIRDEKVSLSATYLPAGTYQYTYTLTAGLAGEFRVLPPSGYEFYFPEVGGRGEGTLFTIEP